MLLGLCSGTGSPGGTQTSARRISTSAEVARLISPPGAVGRGGVLALSPREGDSAPAFISALPRHLRKFGAFGDSGHAFSCGCWPSRACLDVTGPSSLKEPGIIGAC